MPVRILDESLINKIAAGEVVERPASVVKELFENALDAGSTEVVVHLRAGGRNLVRVVDNGSGMSRTDAMMCLERHATSKIRTEADLFAVGTLGFRGEAIPSIASVSRFTLLSRLHDAEMGTRIQLEGGKLTSVAPAGAPPGTDISAESLFFNVPARRKFLRAAETELGHCTEAVSREAMIRPDVDVELIHEERTLLRCPRVKTRHERAAALLGEHGRALVPIQFRRGVLEVEALVSPVGVHRSSVQGASWLYVNGRYVRDGLLRRAVSQAYAGVVPKDRHPVIVLEVRVPAHEVDVNAHPAKVEVRFANAFELASALAAGLRQGLVDHGVHRPVQDEARYREPEAGATQLDLPGMGEGPQRPGAQEPIELVSGAAQPRRSEAPTESIDDLGENRPQPDAPARETRGAVVLDAGPEDFGGVGVLRSPPFEAEVLARRQTDSAPEIQEVAAPSAPGGDRVPLTAPRSYASGKGPPVPVAPPRPAAAPPERTAAPPERTAAPPERTAAPPLVTRPAASLPPAPGPTAAGAAAPGPIAPRPPIPAAIPVIQRDDPLGPVDLPPPAIGARRPGLAQQHLRSGPPVGRPLLPVRRFRDLRIIGQLAATYLLCEAAGALVLVDQHAAHERVMLERLLRDPGAAIGPAQRFLSPLLVELPSARARLLAAHLDQLSTRGLEISALGGGTLGVLALPTPLKDADLATLLSDLADDLAEGGSGVVAEKLTERVLATMACHSAVRAGQTLSMAEMEALLRQLDGVDFGVCAHGRPVAVVMGQGEIERRFHRA